MRSFLAAAVLVTWIVGSWAAAEEARPISSAQLQKVLTFVDTIGAKEEFPAPTAQNLGVSDDPNLVLPVTVVVTNDHKVYFCRSELNPADYIVWVRTADKESSYMFLTHADLKLVRALHLRANGFPDVLNSPPAQVEAIYKDALLALGKDVDHSR
jgi:hypothetical protein